MKYNPSTSGCGSKPRIKNVDQFRLIVKLGGRCRNFSHASYPHKFTSYSTINTHKQSDNSVLLDDHFIFITDIKVHSINGVSIILTRTNVLTIQVSYKTISQGLKRYKICLGISLHCICPNLVLFYH